MNKYGGISDIHCDKRIYNLWYQMLRRCYDTEQHIRNDTEIDNLEWAVNIISIYQKCKEEGEQK